MNDKKELIKQVKLLTIVLIIVIVIAVIININNNRNSNVEENTSGQSQNIVYEINGITEEALDNAKGMIDQNIYDEYKELFRQYKEGETPYVPSNEKIDEEDKMTEKDLTSLFTEADEKGEFYYYTTPEGEKTDIKIYKDIELYNY